MKTFPLKIVTPSGIYLETEVNLLNVRTTAGQIGVLANLLPLASGLEIAEMNYVIDGKRTIYAIAGGFIYVGEKETTVIANSIESQDEIDLDRAKAAKQRAEDRIHQDEMDTIRAEIALKKAINRIYVKGL